MYESHCLSIEKSLELNKEKEVEAQLLLQFLHSINILYIYNKQNIIIVKYNTLINTLKSKI